MPDLGMASRKMGGGSGNGGFRTATPFTAPKRVARPPAQPTVCPIYRGTITTAGIYSALSADGTQLVDNDATSSPKQIPHIWTYPGLVDVGTFGTAIYDSIGAYAWAENGSLAYECADFSSTPRIHWISADESTEADIYVAANNLHALELCRWPSDPTRAVLFDLTAFGTGAGNVDVKDLDISSSGGAVTTLGSFTLFDGGAYDCFPIVTTDDAVWYVESPPYAATTPGQIFRWTPGGGSVAVPGIGGANPGIVDTPSYMHLIADGTTVLASIGTDQTDRNVVRIQADLSFAVDACFATLTPDIGFSGFGDSSDPSSFYIRSSSTTPGGTYIFCPKSSSAPGGHHIWGT